MREITHLDQGALAGVLESLLLVSTDAVPAKVLAEAAGAEVTETQQALEKLASDYADANRGIQLREVAGGWRLFTHPAYHDVVEAYVLSWDRRKLSQAALETLSVIAYHQPVTREGIRAVRGVNSDGVIASLREKGLVALSAGEVVLRLLPPLIVKREDCDKAVRIIGAAFKEYSASKGGRK